MKQEDTKKLILSAALELFSAYGYDSVSVGQIAKAVGIKAPSLYNHYESKQAIFDALLEEICEQYQRDTDKINIHVQNAEQDTALFTDITEDGLAEKVRQMFLYSVHNESVSRFRKMMTIEQFRSPQISELYTWRYVTRLVEYHRELFRRLIEAGELRNGDADALAVMYTSPLIVYLGICDRQPEREAECLEKLDAHVRLFYRTYNTGKH